MDWLSDPYEGYLTVNLGMKGKDWDVDSEGNVKVYLDANTKAEKLYPSTNLFKYHTVCTDDAGLFTSYVPQMCTDKANLHYKLKRAGFVIPFDYGFEYLRDESKNNYSVDVASQVTSLIVDSTLDIDTEWAKFIEANRGIWQPVVDALNAELLMK